MPRAWESPSTPDELLATSNWLLAHVEDVYAQLASDRPQRMGELVRLAGDHLPHLLPNAEVRRRDAQSPPSRRIRLERNQALFVRALLSRPHVAARVLADMRAPLPGAREHVARFDRDGVLRLSTVSVRRVGDVGEVTLANTMTLNAETNALALDLETAVDVVSISETTHVGVLRGAPMAHPSYQGRRVFCAGINLKDLAAGKISYLDFLLGREAGLLAKMLRGVRLPDSGQDVASAWVAIVDEFAIGGGLQLTLVCDHVAAVDNAWFSLPAASEGIVPGAANLRLPHRVGLRLARDMILHGRRLASAKALDAGLIDAVATSVTLEQHVQSVAAAFAQPAVAANKRMLAHGFEPESRFAEYLAEFAVSQAERMHADDVRDKVTAVSS